MLEKTGATGAIIVAAGKGNRMGLGYNKVLAPLCGKSVLERTIQCFVESKLIDYLVVAISPNDEKEVYQICQPYIDEVRLLLVHGGKDRQDSVYNGLKALHKDVSVVLIHDGARPLVDREIICRSIDYANKYGAACAGMPVKDTIKIVDEAGIVNSTPDRNRIWSAQTPQSFRKDVIMQAYAKANENGIRSTDDAGLAEKAGFKVTMFEGSYSNIKLTSAEDIFFAEQILNKMTKSE